MAFDFEQMRSVIAETSGCDLDKVVREASLSADLDIDSLSAVELVIALEEAFDTEIDDTDIEQFKTVADLADYLEKALQ